MFNQFRVRYPKGCLVAELITIEHGKYIVRAMVEIEKVTLATALGSGETVEAAEDLARSRVLAVLGIQTTNPTVSAAGHENVAEVPMPLVDRSKNTTVAEVPLPPVPSLIPQPPFSPEDLTPINPSPITLESFSEKKSVKDSDRSFLEPTSPTISPQTPPVLWESNSIPFADDDDFPPDDDYITSESDAYELEEPPSISSFSSVESNEEAAESTQDLPTSASKFSASKPQINTIGKNQPSSAIDFSDAIAKIEILIKNLRWTDEQERDYLKRTYGKVGRSLLTNEDLLDFLQYLESLSLIITQTDEEIKRLGWNAEQGRNYLIQTYGKRGRSLLTKQELLDFLHHLQSQPSP